MPWWAFKHGLTGAGFWVYADSGSASWHDYATPMGYYGVVYGSANAPVDTHGEKIIPSCRWEAWREGVEDYQYLITLQTRIDRVQAVAPDKAARALQRLKSFIDLVLKGDGNRITQVRQEITEMILDLDKEPQ
jgi:hypothetical protein